jgi:pyruvate kinase
MDIAGPKIRTTHVAAPDRKSRIQPGDMLRLVTEGDVESTKEAPFCARIALPGLLSRLATGDHVAYDDGRLLGQVTAVSRRWASVRILHAKAGGVRLKPEKGVNFPDTELDLAALTDQDRADLDTVVGLADIVGYSFVSEAADIDLLEDALARRPRTLAPLGLVAKIERPQAVRNLPALIGRASGVRPFGVMIARGDLAAELGFERMAEMQEELLWLCEAAHVPVIWATQVLENLVKDGVPSRGEMTDAAMATRAECIMLNKGPEVIRAISLLDRLYQRMDGHMHKKTPTLRPLRAFEPIPLPAPAAPPHRLDTASGEKHADHESRRVRRARPDRSKRKART